MYHSAVVPLSATGTLPALNSSSSEEELQPQTFVASLQRIAAKSLLLSPLTFTRSFSPATLALLQVGGGGGGGTVSPLVHHSSQSLENTCPDLTGLLPAEIMVYILLHLDPQDLCSVSAVCNRWYQLAQCSVLDRRRKVYVEQRREEYQLSKENYTPAGTPGSRAPTTTAPSPLGHIQPLSPLSTSQPPSPSIWESPTSHTSSPTLIAPPPPILYTPWPPQPTSPSWNTLSHSPTLLDDVKFLSLDDNQDIVLYRPLSPDLRWVESTLYSLRQVASRKNKNRLRRL